MTRLFVKLCRESDVTGRSQETRRRVLSGCSHGFASESLPCRVLTAEIRASVLRGLWSRCSLSELMNAFQGEKQNKNKDYGLSAVHFPPISMAAARCVGRKEKTKQKQFALCRFFAEQFYSANAGLSSGLRRFEVYFKLMRRAVWLQFPCLWNTTDFNCYFL